MISAEDGISPTEYGHYLYGGSLLYKQHRYPGTCQITTDYRTDWQIKPGDRGLRHQPRTRLDIRHASDHFDHFDSEHFVSASSTGHMLRPDESIPESWR